MPVSSTTDRGVRNALLAGVLVVAGGLLLLPPPAEALAPGAGPAVVDGSPAEWTPADEVAPLVGNDPPHLARGRVSLRYDCADEVLYALVLAGPGLRLEATDADEAYLRFGTEAKLVSGTDGTDGSAPDAAWVDLHDGTAAGIEMSTPLAPGDYEGLRVHAKLPDDSDDGYETLDLAPRHQDLAVECGEDPAAVAVALTDPGADPADPADPPGLARTGAPLLPLLAGSGTVLVALGAAVRGRRWGRRAGP